LGICFKRLSKFCIRRDTALRWNLDLTLKGKPMLLAYKKIEDYAEFLKARFIITGVSGTDVGIEAVERHPDLALGVIQYLDDRMRGGEISIEEAHAEQLLDFIEAVYFLCLHEEGAFYHRRSLEEWMRKLAADKLAQAS